MLLDIEGTVAPVSFVYDVLFPYARLHGPRFIQQHWDDEPLREARIQLREQNHMDELEGAPRISDTILSMTEYVLWLMDRDRKVTPLKTIQGLIWKQGFDKGELRGQIFPDVPTAFARWRGERRTIAIYSSGSVLAQQQLFRNSDRGDLTPFIDAYFDTLIGGKRNAQSYAAIAERLASSPGDILFASDVLEELDAAKSAGFDTVLCVRPGNAPIMRTHDHKSIRSFDELEPLTKPPAAPSAESADHKPT